MEEIPDADIIVVPIGGGVSISGISIAAKQIEPNKNLPSMVKTISQNHTTTVEGPPTIADGIAVKTPEELTLKIIKQYVDDIVTVDEDE